MLSCKGISTFLVLAVAFLNGVNAVVAGGETCAGGVAYLIYPDTGPQYGYCGNNPKALSRRYAACFANAWAYDYEGNNGMATCVDANAQSAGCPVGFRLNDDTSDSTPPTCTASSCIAAGTCQSSCTGVGGTYNANMCSGLTYCTSSGECPYSYQTCSPTTGRCGTSCGAAEDYYGDPTPGFCYGTDFCADKANGLCSACPGPLNADGKCPNYIPTVSTAAEARKKKRKLAYLQTLLKNPDCPVGLQSCPITGSRGAYECLDTDQELTSCGGCASDGTGEDCSSMLGVSRLGGATCVKGECEARSCIVGFKLVDGRCE